MRTLRHGMAGAPGLEIWGPYESYDQIRDAILEAGREFGMEPVRLARLLDQHARVGLDPLAAAGHLHRRGAAPLPRVAAAPTATRRPTPSPAASSPTNIEDYYTNPWDLGYGSFVKFDHDFIGRDALEAMDKDTQRRKVTLEWNSDDLAKLLSLLAVEGAKYQFFDLPNANYGSSNFDSVVDADGTCWALSMFTGISANEKKGLSLATISPDVPHRRRGARGLGRARRRQQEDHRRAARAVRGPRHRQPGSLRQDGAGDLPRRLAERAPPASPGATSGVG